MPVAQNQKWGRDKRSFKLSESPTPQPMNLVNFLLSLAKKKKKKKKTGLTDPMIG